MLNAGTWIRFLGMLVQEVAVIKAFFKKGFCGVAKRRKFYGVSKVFYIG